MIATASRQSQAKPAQETDKTVDKKPAISTVQTQRKAGKEKLLRAHSTAALVDRSEPARGISASISAQPASCPRQAESDELAATQRGAER